IRLDGAISRFGFPSLVVALLSLLAAAQVSAQPGAQVHKDWMEGVHAAAEETVRIARARDRFSNATDGHAMEAAWKKLDALLTKKDELYMYFAIIGDNEPEKQELFRLRGTIPILAAAGNIDGGIPEPLRGAFA